MPDPSSGLAGHITTYQDVVAVPDLHLRRMRRYRNRTRLVIDEVHHLPEGCVHRVVPDLPVARLPTIAAFINRKALTKKPAIQWQISSISHQHRPADVHTRSNAVW